MPARRPLPAELPARRDPAREPLRVSDCGGKLRPLGEDVSEMLEYVPSHFKVIRHVRPKLSCASCQRIVQPLAPSRPIERGLAGPGLLAHVLVSKYCDHLPLYRQSQIMPARGSILTARPSPTGSAGECIAGALGEGDRPLRTLGAYKITAMTPRCRYFSPAAAPPSKDGYGPTCAMIGRRAAPILRRCSSAIARIAR